MKKIPLTIAISLASIAISAISVVPAFAATVPAVSIKANAQVSLGGAQAKADTAITARISALNSLQTRVNAMTKVSASEKASLDASIQSALQNMTSLKAKIDADTDAATLKTDVQSITKDNRIYMLIIPQGRIEASADRVQTIVSLMNTLGTKLQARITADQASSNYSAMQSSYTNFQAKVADANTQSTAAISLIATLQPDQGNATTMQSNNAALKQAIADIKTATADLKAARTDAGTIASGLKADESTSASTSTSTVSH